MNTIVKTINLWGVKINIATRNELIQFVDSRLKQKQFPIHITGINPETVVHASSNLELNQAIKESDFVNIDNNFIVLTLRLLGYKVPSRIATPDLFEDLLHYASENNLSVFILGAKQYVLERAVSNIKTDHPNLTIDGRNGYYNKEQEGELIEHINSSSVDILFLALPSPQKESFILKYKKVLNVKLLLGIGGAVDCRANIVSRGPKFLRDNGFEGIMRALQNPFNYGKRYLTYYPKFIFIVLSSLKKAYGKN